MTTTIESPTTTGTMNAADLHRILSDVKPFMSKDRTVPAICAVRVECSNGNIVAVATDRFTLGVSRADYSGQDFCVNLSAAAVDNILRIAKTPKRDADARFVSISVPSFIRDDEANLVEFEFAITGETSLSVRGESHDFPRWRQLLGYDTIQADDQQVAMTGYNTEYLARFAKVAGDKAMRLFSRGRAKPSVVMIGDNFVGLVMPARVQETSCSRPAWAI